MRGATKTSKAAKTGADADIAAKSGKGADIAAKSGKGADVAVNGGKTADIAAKGGKSATADGSVDKAAIIRKCTSRYKKLFKGLPDNKRFLAEQIYPEAAFCTASIAELRARITVEGIITEQVNGNGFTRLDASSAQKEYHAVIRDLCLCTKTLSDIAPELRKEINAEQDELMAFLSRKK